MVFADTGENPAAATTHWRVWANRSSRNTGACSGEEEGPPALSGIGMLLWGTAHSSFEHNRTFANRPTGPSVVSGGIVLASSKQIGGADPRNNLIRINVAHRNRPYDLLWDGTGNGNRFVRNDCSTSRPDWLCP